MNSLSFAPSPLHLAEYLRSRSGFVWLDSATPSAITSSALIAPKNVCSGLSILAAEPDLILEGEAQDWPLLEQELIRRERPTVYPGLPEGAAIGYFRYDGSFYFGFYEKLHCYTAPFLEKEEPKLSLRSQCSPLRTHLDFRSDISSQDYCKMVREAQLSIAAGDIYQVCLAHRFQASFHEDPWPLYLSLRNQSPAPFAAYLQLPKEAILSSSPECFLKISGRHIMTRPIKGTAPRGKNKEEDARYALELQQSQKEQAELVMITDVERNDLGKICLYGSVTTPQLLQLESYPQVFHLVSTVQGVLKPHLSHSAALASCLPGGSISGAPKKRAMEIIKDLEVSPRGLFTGAIGYFGFNGESQFNIAIRTIRIASGIAEFSVGAGITCDSLPEKEWQETLHKAAGILQAARA